MERSSKHFAYGGRQSRPQGFLATAMWVLPTMAVMVVVGFFGALFVSKTYLHPTQVQAGRPKPIRVLTPTEAEALARDDASPVWTEGVKDEDIPKLESNEPKHRSSRRRSRTEPRERTTTETPATPTETPSTPVDAPTTPAPATPEPTTPAPDTAPADGATD